VISKAILSNKKKANKQEQNSPDGIGRLAEWYGHLGVWRLPFRRLTVNIWHFYNDSCNTSQTKDEKKNNTKQQSLIKYIVVHFFNFYEIIFE